jgi:hypothetical protein
MRKELERSHSSICFLGREEILVPHSPVKRRETSNQPTKPTAPLRGNFSVFRHDTQPWLLFLVRPMRALAIVAALICCTSAFGQKWTHGSGPCQTAMEAYFSRVGTIIFNTVVPQSAKHPERLSGAARFALRITSQDCLF